MDRNDRRAGFLGEKDNALAELIDRAARAVRGDRRRCVPAASDFDQLPQSDSRPLRELDPRTVP